MLTFQALKQFQNEIDNARQLLQSSVAAKLIDVGICTTVIQRLQSALEAAGLAEDSLVTVAAKKLISSLNVKPGFKR